ncbi:zinc finger protein Xfin-like isoform X2 [Aethina tumida]|uniref:zinc finger protein Xfin-like isoform X2 n=1 Tax=Aethina tumida TaxID=116153 RepID=UPI0021479D03|nr:zinc finger protein Xfin-like isoform X2 [Aethina tumida]
MKMLANQGFTLDMEKADLGNLVTEQLEMDKTVEQYPNIPIIHILGTLPNGNICLVGDDQFLQQHENNTIEVIEQQENKNIRTILLPPPQTSEPHQELENSLNNTASKPTDFPYKCFKCSEKFMTILQYRKHMIWHRHMKKYKCTKCSAGYNVESNLKIHMAMHIEGKPTCPICNLSFQRKASLKSHLFIHQVEETYVCEECKAEFDKEDDLIKHFEIHATNVSAENKILTCSYCKVEFEDTSTYREHISHHIKAKKLLNKGKRTKKKSTKDGKFVCEQCNKSFIKHSLLERHERIHTGVRPFVCHICKRGFTQRGTLHIHMKRHEGIKPYECTLCPAKFGQKGNLKVHIEKTHTASSSEERKFKCFICPCIFKKVSSLNAHMTRVHTKNPPDVGANFVMEQLKRLEECVKSDEKIAVSETTLVEERVAKKEPEADYGYLTSNDSVANSNGLRKYLVKQKKIGDTRFYFCNYCMKQFKKPSDLIRHIRIHTKEKPFKCKTCSSCFSLKSTLLAHIKTHEAKTSLHTCSLCNASFYGVQKLAAHLKRHNIQTVNYICKQCNQIFNTQEDATQHSLSTSEEKHSVTVLIKSPLPESPHGLNQMKIIKPRITAIEDGAVKRIPNCNICNQKFSKVSLFRQHMKNHSEKNNICPYCSKSFRTPLRLNVHMNYHMNIRNYQCGICAKKFVTSHMLKRHQLVHVTQKPYGCNYCEKKFKTSMLCKQHVRRVHKIESTLTNNDQGEISTVLNFSDMINEDDPVKNSDEIGVISDNLSSENIFQTTEVAENQFYSIPENIQVLTEDTSTSLLHNDNPFETYYINSEGLLVNNANVFSEIKLEGNGNFLLKTVGDLQEKTVFNENLNINNQEIINVNHFFNNEQEESQKTEKHQEFEMLKTDLNNLDETLLTDPILFTNEVSTENLLSNNDLISADTLMTDPNSYTNYICSRCNKMYPDIDNFKKHNCDETLKEGTDEIKIVAENVTGFKCSVCSKVFKSKQTLSKHSEMHGKERKSTQSKVCNFCQKEFKKNCDLQRHLRTHTGERPFACKKCDKKFALKSTLMSHIRTHDPNVSKKFNCSVCNSFFISKSTLKMHMSVHTGSRPYECSFCPMKYRTLKSKNQHEASKHKSNQKGKPPQQSITSLLASVANEIVPLEQPQTSSVLITADDINTDVNQELAQPLQIVSGDLLQHLQTSDIIIQDQATLDALPSIIRLEDLSLLNLKIDNTGVAETFPIIATETQVETVLEKPRIHECDICHKSYASKDVLRKHRKTHGLNKTYFCELCIKGFDKETDFEKHNKVHMGYRPYSCHFCNNSFSDLRGLNSHVKRIHGGVQ